MRSPVSLATRFMGSRHTRGKKDGTKDIYTEKPPFLHLAAHAQNSLPDSAQITRPVLLTSNFKATLSLEVTLSIPFCLGSGQQDAGR